MAEDCQHSAMEGWRQKKTGGTGLIQERTKQIPSGPDSERKE